MIRSILLAAVIATFAGGAAFAQETCESKAVGKDGKALAGAAKTSFMKKCMADTCAAKAVSADGKPLAGRSYLVVTVPTYIRWDQPEVSK